MENLQQEKLSLEQSTSELLRNISELDELLQELKERERLLVSFPDLHIPAEAQFESKRGCGEGQRAADSKSLCRGQHTPEWTITDFHPCHQ